MDDREVMAVISLYPSEEINSELEARLMSHLVPNEVIGGALLAGRLVQQAPPAGADRLLAGVSARRLISRVCPPISGPKRSR